MSESRHWAKHVIGLEERLIKAAEDLRARARELPPGLEQDALLKKAREFETQVSMNQLFAALPSTERNSIDP